MKWQTVSSREFASYRFNLEKTASDTYKVREIAFRVDAMSRTQMAN
jgi:hypothetical protein